MIAFVSGGVRSGKSEAAEQLVLRWGKRDSQKASAAYIATAQRTDSEMKQRIQIHQDRRGDAWITYELSAASDLGRVLRRIVPESPVLLDCVTIWASRMLFEENREPDSICAYWTDCLRDCRDRRLAAVIVSNDLNEGMPMRDEWTQVYMRLLERLHRLTVEEADIAVQTIVGIPLVWKGEHR
ncbi:bifunctional adenosylcobinamide kinase/adenosylcobinamide-phosphate guanylyltransferase [Xylanibacillus composti]|uniref:Adenosylcobinamide kinase n=1 Tax=Xylanibacillus composti TaxID=1572762 RepID=A0A8J4H197_9BACL|nr:bifunctional adenosylcobinamide kinase/adenosylcobinamide-phosphate guanylyltransferase [Xylanibacillus composti]GIQ67735.1 adenosylcobinamide kinase/adenosylcobinamide phosphate guanyltransferase [Xylanibacillus composti]